MSTQEISNGTILALRSVNPESYPVNGVDTMCGRDNFWRAVVQIDDQDDEGPVVSMSEQGGDLWTGRVLGEREHRHEVGTLAGCDVTLLFRADVVILRAEGGREIECKIVSTFEGITLAFDRAVATNKLFAESVVEWTDAVIRLRGGEAPDSGRGIEWSLADGSPSFDPDVPRFSDDVYLAAGEPWTTLYNSTIRCRG